MKKVFMLALIAVVMMGTAAFAENVEDYEGYTAGASVHSCYDATYSGQAVGVLAASASNSATDEQVHGGSYALKQTWTWENASGGFTRFAPTVTANWFDTPADHTTVPFYQIWVYGASQGDLYQAHLRDTGYETSNRSIAIDFNGWDILEWDCATEGFTGWINGDGALDLTNSYSYGWFVTQGAGQTEVTYFIDDVVWAAASAVQDWTIY